MFLLLHVKLESASEDGLTLPAGSFKYPFQMALPPSLPSSFEGKYGYVRYTVKAKIDRPWKFDHELKTAFTVLSLLDLNMEQPSLRVRNIFIFCLFQENIFERLICS